MSEAFFEPLGDGRFRSTAHTRGPWDPRSQHAGPPAALLGRALERCEPREDMLLARLTFEILAPVPVADLELEARKVRPGRSVELLEAEMRADGRTVMTVRGWRVLGARSPTAGVPQPPPPRPVEETPLPAEWETFGYGHAMELRFAAGGWDIPGPATAWSRLRVGVVAGEEPTGLQRVLAIADSGNGVAGVLPLSDYLYINPELTVHVLREPRGEWICLDARTAIVEGAAGLARSTLSDEDGMVAAGAQSLLVAPR